MVSTIIFDTMISRLAIILGNAYQLWDFSISIPCKPVSSTIGIRKISRIAIDDTHRNTIAKTCFQLPVIANQRQVRKQKSPLTQGLVYDYCRLAPAVARR